MCVPCLRLHILKISDKKVATLPPQTTAITHLSQSDSGLLGVLLNGLFLVIAARWARKALRSRENSIFDPCPPQTLEGSRQSGCTVQTTGCEQ